MTDASSAAALTPADLVLVRMAVAAKPPPPAKVRADVGGLLGRAVAAAEFDALRERLRVDGLVSPGKRRALAVTAAGRARAARVLGLRELPPRLTWPQVIARHLFPRASGLTPEQAAKLTDGDKLAAHLLKTRLKLTGTSVNTVTSVVAAYVCREIGFPEERTIEGVVRLVLARLVGPKQRLNGAGKALAEQVARHELGVRKLGTDEIRARLIAQSMVSPATVEERPATLDVPAFARAVLALAHASPPADRFYDNKVFIAPLWRASQRDPKFPRLALDEFKARLVEANGRHLLHLSRADLVGAMDARLVAESETKQLSAVFHFVRLEGTVL